MQTKTEENTVATLEAEVDELTRRRAEALGQIQRAEVRFAEHTDS